MFRSDVSVLAKTRAKELPQLHYISHTGSTYTVLWNPAAWDSHISTWRYVRHIMTWHLSSTARVIVPVVATFTAWAAFVCLAEPAFGIKLTMTMAPLTLVSSALALLLTLRTNQSLTRLLEARLAWGKAVLHARILAGMLLTRVCPVNPSAAFLCGRLLSTVGWSLRSSLLGPSVDRDALDSLLPPEEAEWIASQRKPSLAALDRVGYIMRELSLDTAYSSRPLAAEAHRVILEELVNLDGVVGICERILSSPVPPTYTRFTSRMLVLWLACIPLALKGMHLSPPTVIFGTFLTAYIMIGIDEIAIEIEEPMRLLPLNQICNACMLDIVSRLAPDPPMPPLRIGAFLPPETKGSTK